MTSDLNPSDMARETGQAPQIVASLLSQARPKIAEIGRLIGATNPPLIVTCARGSSDHAAGHFKYCTEILAGVPVASVGPSVASLYRAPLRLRDGVLLAISQSGMSPDIVALAKAAKSGGARVIAIVNDEASDLAEISDICLPIGAGTETSVAATKTFIASTVAAQVQDQVLRAGLFEGREVRVQLGGKVGPAIALITKGADVEPGCALTLSGERHVGPGRRARTPSGVRS